MSYGVWWDHHHCRELARHSANANRVAIRLIDQDRIKIKSFIISAYLSSQLVGKKAKK